MDEFVFDPISARASDLALLAAAEKTASKAMRPILREAALAILFELRCNVTPQKTAELIAFPGGAE